MRGLFTRENITIWGALGLIAIAGFALIIPAELVPAEGIAFIEVAREQKHPLLLFLAAQAVIITLLTSKLAENPKAKTGTIIAGLAIFAAELGQLKTASPTEVWVTLAALVPISLLMTNLIPWPNEGFGKLVAVFLMSFAALVALWLVSIANILPTVAIIARYDFVALAMISLVLIAFAGVMASGIALIGIASTRLLMDNKSPPSNNSAGRGNPNSRGRARRRRK